MTVPVRFDTSTLADQCADTTLTNTATTSFGSYGATPMATTLTTVDRSQHSYNSSTTGTWKRELPKPSIRFSGQTHVTPGTGEIVTMTIENTSSVLLNDSRIELMYPTIMVNGVERKLSVQVMP